LSSETNSFNGYSPICEIFHNEKKKKNQLFKYYSKTKDFIKQFKRFLYKILQIGKDSVIAVGVRLRGSRSETHRAWQFLHFFKEKQTFLCII